MNTAAEVPVEAEFDQHSGVYSETIDDALSLFGKGHDFFVRSKVDILLPAFASISSDITSLKVLDVGCGVGLVHRYIAGSVGKLHGTDVSGASLEVARKANPSVDYVPYDGMTLPYGAASFDCAYAICVMHHVPVKQWKGFLEEMRRVVRPGGMVIIIEHNPLHPATQWVVRTTPMDANAVLLWPWRLHRLMKAAGIGSLRTRYVVFLPFAGRVARLIDRLFARLPFGTQYVLGGRV
jgi:ubiquinone/menaquinone biosynthesis C-methylase UbiE